MANRTALFSQKQSGGVFTITDAVDLPCTGNIWFVDSSNTDASDAEGYGQNPDSPFATIDYAIGQCTDNGDVIICAPGHVETVIAAGGLDLDTAGVTIICQGNGSNCATITFTTLTTADMDVDAANITLVNPRFVAGIDALVGPIDVNAADFRIVNGEWYDGALKQTVDCIVADANADRLVIDGWTFHEGTAGTQKQSQIQVAGATNVVIKDPHITGDFGTGNIENGTAWVNALIIDPLLENTNATPKPGIALAATGTGNVVGAKVTIASGTVPVTADNDMQWYDSAYSTTDGSAWGTIGSIPAASLEGKVDLVLADTTIIKAADNKIDGVSLTASPAAGSLARFVASGGTALGTPLADSKSLVDALGTNGTTLVDSTTSVIGVLGVNDADNAFVSSAVVANADGSILERLEFAQNQANKLDAVSLAAAPVAGSLGRFVASGGTALGTPLADSKSLVDALGTNGTTLVDSATSVIGVLGVNDADNEFASNLVAANADGSVLEREEYIQAQVALVKADTDKIDAATLEVDPAAGSLAQFVASGGTALGTPLADSKSLVDALGTNGSVVSDSATSVLGAIGANSADNAFVSTLVAANADGSVLERLEFAQNQANKLDAVSLAAAPIAGSLARFVASGGTALGTPLADSKSLVDALGTNGTTLVDSTTSVVGILGVNDADNAFVSDAVVANEDGSILERQQYAQDQIALVKASTDKLDAASLAAAPVAGSMARFVASGGTALGTPLADSKSLVDALGTNGTTLVDSATSVIGVLGVNDADNEFASNLVAANADGSVLERQEYAQDQIALVKAATDKIDTATLAVAPAAGSLARFVASGGTALGTPLADSKSLVDALGTNGTTLVDSATSVIGVLGVNDADNEFASNLVAANADGSVLEREEYIQGQVALVKADTDKIDAATLEVAPTAGSLGSFVASGGTALGTQLPDSKSIYDMVRQYGDGYVATKTLTYDGNASYNVFTVTGGVMVKVVGYITTVLTNNADTTSVGTATSVAGLIAATAGTSMQTANTWWVDNAPSKFETFPAGWSLIGNGEEIVVASTANLVGGVVSFVCFWKPLTADGAVVAA